MRSIDNHTAVSPATRRAAVEPSYRPFDKDIRELDVAVRIRDRFEATVPGRIQGPQLDDLQPRFCAPAPNMSDATGAGWSTETRGTRASQRACYEHVEKLHHGLSELKLQYTEWKNANPGAPEPTDGELPMSAILERPVHEQCVRILCVVIHEHPEVLAQAGVEAPSESPVATQPQQGGDFPSEMGKLFGPLAQMLGGLLSNPLVITALTAGVALIPGGQAVAPFIPMIAPIAGMLLSAGGGMVSGAPAAPGAAGGMPDLGALLGAVGPLLGAVGGAPAAAPAPVPVTA